MILYSTHVDIISLYQQCSLYLGISFKIYFMFHFGFLFGVLHIYCFSVFQWISRSLKDKRQKTKISRDKCKLTSEARYLSDTLQYNSAQGINFYFPSFFFSSCDFPIQNPAQGCPFLLQQHEEWPKLNMLLRRKAQLPLKSPAYKAVDQFKRHPGGKRLLPS